ncbi:hypothetical protein OCAE111667_04090 [Occultella aeris]|uniref:Uncharacterized protein n=1 Tax=Occultella aeris TaxID=2761496 RepID=A0A7M4DG96_9MICO|nr:hypothetical protein [Occultella aeris]VZO35939.1 hypothetical protein HALOF300_01142 [Occultella aeris]
MRNDDPGHSITICPAVPGSPSDDKLRKLLAWAATDNIAATTGSPAAKYPPTSRFPATTACRVFRAA